MASEYPLTQWPELSHFSWLHTLELKLQDGNKKTIIGISKSKRQLRDINEDTFYSSQNV